MPSTVCTRVKVFFFGLSLCFIVNFSFNDIIMISFIFKGRFKNSSVVINRNMRNSGMTFAGCKLFMLDLDPTCLETESYCYCIIHDKCILWIHNTIHSRRHLRIRWNFIQWLDEIKIQSIDNILLSSNHAGVVYETGSCIFESPC